MLPGGRFNYSGRNSATLLDQGVPIGGIGVQGHLHGDSFDPNAVRDALEKLAEFNLPIRVTEFNMPGQRSRFYKDRNLRMTEADEKQKAQNLVDYYRICFAQPRVEGILMWGFWEGANWIPASSLYKRDWTALPAATAYRDLVFNQWWTRWRGRTDANGRCEVRAFYGKHRITAGDKKGIVELSKAKGEATISLK
jgi:GH35 family endo-1,4-beta-xylanase